MSNLDPNLVVGLIVALGGYLYHAVRGDRGKAQSSIADLARSFVDQALHAIIVGVESRAADIREQVLLFVWSELERHGVKRSKALEPIVAAIVEQGIAAALREAREHDRLVKAAIEAQLAVARAELAKLPRPEDLPAYYAKLEADAIARGRAILDAAGTGLPPEAK